MNVTAADTAKKSRKNVRTAKRRNMNTFTKGMTEKSLVVANVLKGCGMIDGSIIEKNQP